MLSGTTGRQLDRFWAAYLGRPLVDGVSVVPHAEALLGYAGLLAFRRGDACVISTPPALRDSIVQAVDGTGVDDVFTVDYLTSLLPGTVIGPAWYGYRDQPLEERHPAVRRLTTADDDDLRWLAEACAPREWAHSGIGTGQHPTVGLFEDERLVAAAMVTPWEAGGVRLGHIGVACHPALRDTGHGRAVVSAAANRALDAGQLPQYRTLADNLPSRAIATRLGFAEYGWSIAIRPSPSL